MKRKKDSHSLTFLQRLVLKHAINDGRILKTIYNTVNIGYWNGSYREVAKVLYQHWDLTSEAPGEAFDVVLSEYSDFEDWDDFKRKEVDKALDQVYKVEGRPTYALKRITSISLLQDRKKAARKAHDLYEKGKMEEGDEIFLSGIKRGTTTESEELCKPLREDSLDYLDENPREGMFVLNIPELDRVLANPARGELLCWLAPPNVGKSWALIHVGKLGVLQGANVLHITLEMSKKKVKRRYHQTFFSLTTRQKSSNIQEVVKFEKDDRGYWESSNTEEIERMNIYSREGRKYVKDKLTLIPWKDKLIVEKFMTYSLNLAGLRGYIENLIANYSWKPDMIIVDYADLMEGGDEERSGLTKIYGGLRAIAEEYDVAVVTASQGNRGAITTFKIALQHFAEDIKKAAICDIVISINKTEEEEEDHRARLFVCKNRDEEKGSHVLISDNYALGQFCLDSCIVSEDYYDFSKGSKDERF